MLITTLVARARHGTLMRSRTVVGSGQDISQAGLWEEVTQLQAWRGILH